MRPCGSADQRDAAEDEATRPVRTYRRNQEELGGLDSGRSAAPRRFSLSQSNLRIAAPFDSAIRTYCPPMVRRNRVRPDGIQHAHDAEDEANTHLPAHKKFASGAAVAGPYALRENRTISGYRSR